MSSAPGAGVTRRLSYRPPFDGVSLLGFLKRRAVTGVEEVTDGAYRRSLTLPHGAGLIELRPKDTHVRATFWLDDQRDLETAAEQSRALLDLHSEPQAVLRALGDDPLIGDLVHARPGRRVPGHVDGDELAIRAVLGQQVSLAGAGTLAQRLVGSCGQPLEHPNGTITHRFPSAQQIAAVDPETLAMPRSRRQALLGLARALAEGTVVLSAADREQAQRGLLALPGIGPWTAGYIAMRALGDRDVFLPTDLGVRHALQVLGADDQPSAATRLAERWRPYRSYAMLHLWATLTT